MTDSEVLSIIRLLTYVPINTDNSEIVVHILDLITRTAQAEGQVQVYEKLLKLHPYENNEPNSL